MSRRFIEEVNRGFRRVFAEFCSGDSQVFVSFGGLLLHLQGPYKKLTPLRIDYVYLLVKK